MDTLEIIYLGDTIVVSVFKSYCFRNNALATTYLGMNTYLAKRFSVFAEIV